MPQLAIYIDDNLSKKLNKIIKVSGKSLSKWVADLIKAKLKDEWPEDFFKLAGSWEGKAEKAVFIKAISYLFNGR